MRRIPLIIGVGILLGLTISCVLILIHSYLIFSKLSYTTISILSLNFVLLIIVFSLLQQAWTERRKIFNLKRKKQEIAIKLREQQNLFEILFHHTNNGVALLNLDGQFLRVNQSLCQLIGYSELDILLFNYYSLIYSSDITHMQMHIQQLLNNQIKSYQSEQQLYRKNREVIWVIATVSVIRDYENKAKYFLVQLQNITLQKKAEERLRHMAFHDPLTGLANRNKLEQFIIQTLAAARRHHQGFALLFLDLDRFKNINDAIGHEAGDVLLQIIGERLHSSIRNTDMVARLGGDEFVLLISDVTKIESVAVIAKKILENVLKVIMIQGQEIYITTSIGISVYPYDGQTMATLMKNADLALYRAKELGRNNYQFYTIEMTSRAQQRMGLQTALGHALVNKEFLLNYQPKMEIKTQHISGIEALLRWKNDEYGMIATDEIISVAEETGLIIPVSDWVLKTACKQLKKWHEMGLTTLTLAVNCSPRQFKQAMFVNNVQDILENENLSPSCLEIEITERVIMDDPENILRLLYALKDMGVQIVIDDFGTGYWSLGNLRRFSVDKIKIDKSFIKQLAIDETSAAIIRAIIAMVNKLGITSIAEGVETREQYEFLAREGCAEIQGYYLTKPLSDEAMIQFLQNPILNTNTNIITK